METAWPVPEISDVEMAFPANVLDWIPSRDEIPDEFKFIRGKSEWTDIVSAWFFQGLSDKVEFYPAEGVDPEKALRAIKALLGSFQPKHEHKEEAAAYLLSLWFTKVENWKKQPSHESEAGS
jgi:hypothetical protein